MKLVVPFGWTAGGESPGPPVVATATTTTTTKEIEKWRILATCEPEISGRRARRREAFMPQEQEPYGNLLLELPR